MSESAAMGMFPRFTLSRCFRSVRKHQSPLYVLLSSNVADDGDDDAGAAVLPTAPAGDQAEAGLGPAPDSGHDAQEQFEHFVQGAHQMTACALAAIDACSADVPQTEHFLELLAQQGSDRHKQQECLESLQLSFEKHMTEYEEEEEMYMQNLWGSMSTQQQDLQVRLDIGNRLQTLRLQKQKLGEALLWLELMSGPPAI